MGKLLSVKGAGVEGLALKLLGFALVFVLGVVFLVVGGVALCSFRGVLGESLFVELKEAVH